MKSTLTNAGKKALATACAGILALSLASCTNGDVSNALNTYSTQPERSEEALKELEKVPEMGFMSPDRADDATRRFFKDNIDKAKLGDPSGIQQDVTANCPV